jgi:hypothetical protein
MTFNIGIFEFDFNNDQYTILIKYFTKQPWRLLMKKYFVSIAILLIANSHATDLYNSSNAQLTIPSVNVSGTNYNNVVISVGRVVNIGGSGGFSLQNFNSNLYSKQRKAILTAQDSANPPNQYVLTETITPGNDAIFENQLANTVSINLVFTMNGAPLGNYSAQNYFTKGNYNNTLGVNGFGSYTVYGKYISPLKNILNIGDFIYSNLSFSYKDSTKKSVNNYSVYYVSLEQSADANSSYLCTTENQIDPTDVNGSPPINKQCIQVDNNGMILGSVTGLLNVNNTNLYFTGTIQ